MPTGVSEVVGIDALGGVGQAVGSTAMNCVSRSRWSFSRMENAMPPKLEPPPTQPMTTSGYR